MLYCTESKRVLYRLIGDDPTSYMKYIECDYWEVVGDQGTHDCTMLHIVFENEEDLFAFLMAKAGTEYEAR
jgi:hypothetical protein